MKLTFKRTEGFRFTFNEPLNAYFVILINGKPENIERKKYQCEIIDISPRGMKIYSNKDIGERYNQKMVQIEVQFILDEVLIKAIGEIVWKKDFSQNFQYGLIFENQPHVEKLIVKELKLRRKRELSRNS